MDLQKKYYELLGNFNNGLSQVGKALTPGTPQRQQLNTQIKNTLQPIVNTEQNVGRTIIGGLSSIGNQIGKMPIPLAPPAANLTIGNTIQPYVQNKIIEPITRRTDQQQFQDIKANPVNTLLNPLNRDNPLMGSLQAGFAASPMGLGYAAVDALKGGVLAARKGEDVQKAGLSGLTGNNIIGAGDAVTDNPYLAMLGNTAEMGLGFLGPGGIKKGVSLAKGVLPKKNAVEQVMNNEKGIREIIVRYEKTFGEMSNPAKPTLDEKLIPEAERLWQQVYGANRKAPQKISTIIADLKEAYNGARTEMEMRSQGITLGFSETPKIQKDLQFTLQAADNPQQEAQYIGEFVNNAIKNSKGNSLKATRAALEKELNGLVGGQGGYKQNYAVLQTLKQNPDVAPRINAIEEAIAKIDNVGKPNVVNAGLSDVIAKPNQISSAGRVKTAELENVFNQIPDGTVEPKGYFVKKGGKIFPTDKATPEILQRSGISLEKDGSLSTKGNDFSYSRLNFIEDAGLQSRVAEQSIPDVNLGVKTTTTAQDLAASNRMDMNIPLQVDNSIQSKQSPQLPKIGKGDPKMSSPLGGSSSDGSITQVPNSQDPYFNTNKYNMSQGSKAQLNKVIQDVKPQIEKVVGKKLSNAETIKIAENSAKVLDSVVSREQTADFTARLLKTRQQLARAGQSGTVNQEYLDNLIAVKSHATDIARKLQSFSIGADPSLITSREAILDAVLKVEKDSTKILEAAKGVDFNDAVQATNFYRKFIKPTTGEWVDTIRYNSMLSSPNTHINNAFSNLGNTSVIAPIEKTLTGTLDFLNPVRRRQGKPQTQFASEGAAYIKGYFSSIGDAGHAFADVMRGKNVTGNLDVRQIPLSTDKRMNTLSLPTKLLEASDQFFTALVKGGETAALKLRQSKGVNVGDIEGQALSNAKYRLFRSDLFDKRQGYLLNAIDHVTGLIEHARSLKAADDAPQAQKVGAKIVSTIAKFTLPFIKTPMNILKQGIEYGPAGLATIPGAANKTEQLSKVIFGTSAMAATAMLAASGRTTWTEPTDPTKRAAFRAAGLQPYALKIGDNWVSFTKLPPALGFPIAFVAALHDAEQNKTIDENQLNVILNTAAKMGNFFADQSYVKNIGDLVASAKGSPEGMARFVSNYPQQLIPYRALAGWMARIVDPYQRKVNTDAGFLEQQTQQLLMNVPFGSMAVPARTDKLGEPIPNQNKEINAFSPFKVTTERPEQKQYYDMLREKALNTKNMNIYKDKLMKGEDISFPQASASVGGSQGTDINFQQTSADSGTPQDKLKAKLQEDVSRTRVGASGKAEEINNKILYQNSDGGVNSIDLNAPIKGQGIDEFSNQNWNINKALDVYGSNIPQSMKNEAYKKLKVVGNDLEYAYKASKSVDVKVQYVNSQNLSHEELIKRMMTGRVEGINGEQFASNAVIDKLNEQGKLSDYEAKQLKKMKFDKSGKSIAKVGGGKGKKIKLPKAKLITLKIPKARNVKPIKVKVSKVKQYKLAKIKLKVKLKS